MILIKPITKNRIAFEALKILKSNRSVFWILNCLDYYTFFKPYYVIYSFQHLILEIIL